MRLNCETQIVYRMVPYHNHSGRCKKASFTALILDRLLDEKKPKNVTFLLVCTAKNPAGTRYKVDGNIEGLFTRFVDEGKACIRIREPKHDVIISKADATELRLFLRLLHRIERGDIVVQSVFSAPPSQVTRTRDALVVRCQEYRPPQGFPNELKSLTMEDCNLVLLDSNVLALTNLRILNLNANRLQTLPTQLNNLPLQRLTVSQNCITKLHPELFESRLRSCLEYLNVSKNQITVLPETLCGAHKLMALLVGFNYIRKLPDGLGYLSDLQTLDLTNNRLTLLPASLLKLNLSWISVWNNPLNCICIAGHPLEHTAALQQVPWPLIELAARAVVAAGKVELTAEDVPRSLLQLLCTATPCFGCQQPVFPTTAASMTLRVNPHRAIVPGGHLVWSPSHDRMVPVQAFMCSTRCLPH